MLNRLSDMHSPMIALIWVPWILRLVRDGGFHFAEGRTARGRKKTIQTIVLPVTSVSTGQRSIVASGIIPTVTMTTTVMSTSIKQSPFGECRLGDLMSGWPQRLYREGIHLYVDLFFCARSAVRPCAKRSDSRAIGSAVHLHWEKVHMWISRYSWA